MKIYKLNGTVINIGEWDYKTEPVMNPIKLTDEQADAEIAAGRDPYILYDDKGNVVTKDTNPLPEGATTEEADVVKSADGGLCLASDYKALRKYPPIAEQLDYIYHNGVEAWKLDMIKPVKDKYPK